MRKALIILLAVMLAVTALVSCDGNIYIDDEFYHTVRFDSNTGIGTMEDQVIAGPAGVLNPNKFMKVDFDFIGWNTERNGTGVFYKNEDAIKISTDITLYAQWAHKTVLITFLANNGTTATYEQKIQTNTPVQLEPARFYYEDHLFTSWNTLEDGSGESFEDEGVVTTGSNMLLYAQWTDNVVKVSFNANGGEGEMETQVEDYGTEFFLTMNTFTRTGYDFTGWNTKADGSGSSFTNGQALTLYGNLSLYAQWEEVEKEVYVYYIPNGGFEQAYYDTAVVGSEYQLDASPFTRSGHTFAGWGLLASGPVVYEDGQTIEIPDEDLRLYAIWEEEATYIAVSFRSNGGEGGMDDQEILSGQPTALSANTFSKAGCEFNGWNTSSDGSGTGYADEEEVTLQSDTILYAQWHTIVPITKITYMPNGGTGESFTEEVETGSVHTLAANTFSRSGFVFTGWALAEGGAVVYANEAEITVPDEDLQLFAVWDEMTEVIIVVFSANGGTGEMTNQDIAPDISTQLNANSYAREGYTFTGWNTASDGSGDSYADMESVIFSMDTVLFAQWHSETAFTVSFDANGGEGKMADQDIEPEVATTLNANAFTYDGHSFVGWNTDADGSGDFYEDEEEVVLTSNLTLCAQWEEDVVYYTVTFNANGGDGEMGDQEIETGVEAELNANEFTYEGYTFVEWNTEADGSGISYEDEEEIVLTSDLILYAQWEEKIDLTGGWSGSGMSLVVNADGSLVMNDGKRDYEGSYDQMFLHFESSDESPLDGEYYIYLNSAETKAYASDEILAGKTDEQIDDFVNTSGYNADIYSNNVIMHLDTGSETVEHALIYGYFPDGTGGFQSYTEHLDPETGDILYTLTEFIPFAIGYPAEPGQQFYLCVEEPGSINYITSTFLYSYDPVEDEIYIPFLDATLERVLPE